MTQSVPLQVQDIGAFTVVQITTISLMEPPMLEDLGQRLDHLVDEQDKRKIILDFERVQFMSSQAIGILLSLNKKLSKLSKSKLILCGVGPRLAQLLQITRLDRILTIKPTQAEAIRS